MTDRERVARALMARASPGTAWEDVSGATREHFLGLADAALAAMAPTWRRIPDDVVEGVAPFDGKPWLLNDRSWPQASIGWWHPQWREWGDADGSALEAPTFYAPIPPLPAPPAGEVG